MVTAIIGKDHYKTELIAGTHTLFADEPRESGGEDIGPTPEEIVQLSLASCTAITLRLYADRKNFPLEKVRVEVSMVRFPERTAFKRDIFLEGVLDDAQRDRLLQIANACPVSKILSHPIEIATIIQPSVK